MGWIREASSGREQRLEPEHLVGRARTCALRVEHRYVSAQHALLRWTEGGWELRDLGSRNGTFLEGRRLRAGEETRVAKNARFAFGKSDEHWQLVDDGAPHVMAIPLDGGDPVAQDGDFLALPSSEDPQATIYRTQTGSWILETAHEPVRSIANLQTFEVAGRAWRFSCPDSASATSVLDFGAEIAIRDLELAFSVSMDEEHVELRAIGRGRVFDLGARSHNFLLLTLARKRLADAAEGHPDTACGWIDHDDLAHDPSMAPPQLNIDVFRIRKQFVATGAVDAANIVERRPRTRQLRIGTARLSVTTV